MLGEGLTDGVWLGERVWLVDGIGGVTLGVSDGVWVGEIVMLREGVTDGDVLAV